MLEFLDFARIDNAKRLEWHVVDQPFRLTRSSMTLLVLQ